jgi:hypothetical protein
MMPLSSFSKRLQLRYFAQLEAGGVVVSRTPQKRFQTGCDRLRRNQVVGECFCAGSSARLDPLRAAAHCGKIPR